MGQRRTTAPTLNPVTLAEAKDYLRLEATSPADPGTGLSAMITAATEWAEGITRRAFIQQTWALTLDAFPIGAIRTPLGRLLAVRNIKYLEPAGTTITLTGPGSSPPGSAYREALGSDQAGLILPSWNTAWPETRDDEPEAVIVSFDAGYGPAASDVPGAIKQAILYRLADLYEHRGSQDGAWTGIASQALLPYAVREFE